MENLRQFLDPEVVSKIGRMDVRARLVVEGFVAGLHKSPYKGFSVEFSEHRQYMPGDPLRHVDWKVYAKSDKFYVKEYEEETNLRAYIAIDSSGSMGYTSGAISKFQYAKHVAAALTYLMLRQQDSVGLTLFDTSIRRHIGPRASARQLHTLLQELAAAEPGQSTNIHASLRAMTERIKRRGLIIILSDLLDDPPAMLSALKYFRHRKHEVILFHVLDKEETDFGFDREALFEDMETKQEVVVEPWRIRNEYRAKVREWSESIKRECREHLIDYVMMNTRTPFDVALASYLEKRSRLG
ncbi:MAG: DUF58 domain-containing protein [bacterium]